MTPRPQSPQQGPSSNIPRLQPLARPTGGGFGGAGVTGPAANFASLSESLTSAMASLKRVGLEERREEQFLAGAAAAEDSPTGLTEKELVEKGIIPKNASKQWRKGFYNIQGRNQADRFRQEVLDPWLRENIAGGALVDENGVPLPRKDPLEELNRKRSEFVSKLGMGSNIDFITGYNTYADRDISKVASSYTDAVNKFEEERVASLVTSDLSNGIQEWYEAEGALPTSGNLSAFSEKMKSLSQSYGVPLPDNPSEYGFVAIEQFVSEQIRGEDTDLDAVGAFVSELLNHKGLNGNRNYADDPVYRERVDRLIAGLDAAENRAEKRRDDQRQERERGLRRDASLEFGALGAQELVELRRELAQGTGVFQDYSPEDRGVLMEYWSTLLTNSRNAGSVTKETSTEETLGYLRANKDYLSREDAERVILSRAESHGIDISAAYRTIEDIYGDENTELRNQVQTTLAGSKISGAESALKIASRELSTQDQSALEFRMGELKGPMEAAVTDAVRAGNMDEAQRLIDTYIEDIKILTDASNQKVNRREDAIRGGMDLLKTGDFRGAEAAVRADGAMSEDKRNALLSQIERSKEREENDHAITDSNGVTADVYARLRGILSGVGSQGDLGKLIGDPIVSTGADEKPQTAVTDRLGGLLVDQARSFYRSNRGKYADYGQYKTDLADYLNDQVSDLFETYGSEDEKRAFKSLGLSAPGTLAERFGRYKSVTEIETATASEYTIGGSLDVQNAVAASIRSAESGSRVPAKPFQDRGEVSAFDPVSPEPMPRSERYQVGLWEATSQPSLAPRAAFEFLAATRGFSVDEVVSGSVDASLPGAAVERMRANRARVADHKGLIYPGVRRGLPGKDAVRGFELFYSEAEYKKDRETLLAHYDAILQNPSRTVNVDKDYIVKKVLDSPGTVLVFGSQSEIDEYENSFSHPYRSLLPIPQEARAGFIGAQRRLLDLKKEKGYIQ